ncbi:MAG: hypothetical protein M5U28_53805 [Sandaracinaceae bacterium]|nr:hypothetical protein [Sandaracinaceae bacterium]
MRSPGSSAGGSDRTSRDVRTLATGSPSGAAMATTSIHPLTSEGTSIAPVRASRGGRIEHRGRAHQAVAIDERELDRRAGEARAVRHPEAIEEERPRGHRGAGRGRVRDGQRELVIDGHPLAEEDADHHREHGERQPHAHRQLDGAAGARSCLSRAHAALP